jgi:hypothetical protein
MVSAIYHHTRFNVLRFGSLHNGFDLSLRRCYCPGDHAQLQKSSFEYFLLWI